VTNDYSLIITVFSSVRLTVSRSSYLRSLIAYFTYKETETGTSLLPGLSRGCDESQWRRLLRLNRPLRDKQSGPRVVRMYAVEVLVMVQVPASFVSRQILTVPIHCSSHVS